VDLPPDMVKLVRARFRLWKSLGVLFSVLFCAPVSSRAQHPAAIIDLKQYVSPRMQAAGHRLTISDKSLLLLMRFSPKYDILDRDDPYREWVFLKVTAEPPFDRARVEPVAAADLRGTGVKLEPRNWLPWTNQERAAAIRDLQIRGTKTLKVSEDKALLIEDGRKSQRIFQLPAKCPNKDLRYPYASGILDVGLEAAFLDDSHIEIAGCGHPEVIDVNGGRLYSMPSAEGGGGGPFVAVEGNFLAITEYYLPFRLSGLLDPKPTSDSTRIRVLCLSSGKQVFKYEWKRQFAQAALAGSSLIIVGNQQIRVFSLATNSCQ
jgi:hypothetical protein